MKHYFIVKIFKGNIEDLIYEMWSDESTAYDFLKCFEKQYNCGLFLLEVKNV